MLGKSFIISLPPRTVSSNAILMSACLLLLVGLSGNASAQDFNKSFKVLPDSGSLEIKTKMGSVTVVPAVGNTIQITARQGGNTINAMQPTPQGKVSVEVTTDTAVDLVISVPASTALDVLCVKCGVIVKGLRGPVKVSNVENDIQLTGIRSSQVEARSMSGNVYYSGEIMPRGNYFLKSFSGRVDVDLPAGAKFKLEATSGRGGIEINPSDFQLNMQKQTSHLVQGLVESASATVTLWTQDGSIRVRKK
ncbi:MAG: DUF4097 family beta strand repeat protein [Acidobacteria bacterium]|nr:DUF4097 family beta strand repeat protein [Acidobacteriota bacterium]